MVLVGALTTISAPPALAQQRTTPITTWVTAADFPPEWANGTADGGVVVDFIVTADGRANACEVLHSSGPKDLGDRVCALVEQRAKYVPAYSMSGDPVAAEDQLDVSWASGKPIVGRTDFGGAVPVNDPTQWITRRDVFPDRMIYDRLARTVEINLTFRIGADGRASDCAGTSPASPDAAPRSCRLIKHRAMFRPPVGRDGHPVGTDGKLFVRWRATG